MDVALAALIAVGAMAYFAFDLDSEPIFVDEAAYISQAYFGDLYVSGRWDSPLWLEYPAYDLPPLPKYLINLAIRAQNLHRPGREWAIAWYRNTHEARFVSPEILRAARFPSFILGGIGCAAIFVLGNIAIGRRVGFLSAMFLAINPLYRLHARRAMSDIPSESLILVTLGFGLVLTRLSWSDGSGLRRKIFATLATGTFGGLAVLAKLNGGLGLLITWAWLSVFAFSAPRRWSNLATSALASGTAGIVALVAFILLNPFVLAHPPNMGSVPLMAPVPREQSIAKRVGEVVSHRVEVSREAAKLFPNDALTSPSSKIVAMAVQGFGRFGPLGPARSDSTRRFDGKQDWGAAIWLPLVGVGLIRCLFAGRFESGESRFPASWALAIMFCLSLFVVGAFLPLAWDRYFLSIQAGSALMASCAIVSATDSILKLRDRR